ncbi:hypothetical protein [Salinibacter ruber]|uniref:LTD domain-containing protein n=1 Tax=Salinibacter ruber TaxID=146919 RepID=A0A9X2UMU8_9BACT|nr:hypothetical protein [Salinibacter ruber]MBB4091512.1 hypothetical protein [Salinibacter ruber]MCS3616648.1 hypothetical protein [Salinibacter ruber]MCS3675660.1 hypothetical protein [Salinibacter ruber]MCS3785702.1 hypothetical protein [Salinibacter ruber]MCS4037771.1 hypothetical protein [Salinibacter ruber]
MIRPSSIAFQLAALALFALTVLPAESTAQVVVRGALAQSKEASPGTTYEETIELFNQGDTSRVVEVSLSDYTFSYDGTVSYEDPGSHKRSNAPWIDYGGSRVDVPPGEEVEVTCQVDVPSSVNGEAPVGTYWSMVLVEPLNQPSVSADGGIAVQQVRRYGIQVATQIRDTGTPELRLLSTDLQREDDQTVLSLAVENTGTRMDQPKAQIELYGDSGNLAFEQQTSPKRIYPGTSVRYRIDLSGVAPGNYQALLVLQADVARPIGRQFTVEL